MEGEHGVTHLTEEETVDDTQHMPTIQVVMDEDLLRAADGAARKCRVNRSALIRDALRQHLSALQSLELERRDRKGYETTPDDSADAKIWEQVAEWPQD